MPALAPSLTAVWIAVVQSVPETALYGLYVMLIQPVAPDPVVASAGLRPVR